MTSRASDSGLTRRALLRDSLLASASMLIAPWSSGFAHSSSNDVLLPTRYGKVRGTLEQGVRVFKGVPYGSDTSKRRFLPPMPPAAWKGIRDALAYGPACPQLSSSESVSEDCLHLNIWTPALHDAGRRPILVYIHGGEFSSGSGSAAIYDGGHLCRRGDVVVVTINHRLNAF